MRTVPAVAAQRGFWALLFVFLAACGGSVKGRGDSDNVTARADTYTGQQDQALTVGTPGVLANDESGQGRTLYVVMPPPQATHGTLSMLADGGFVYTPSLGFVGSDGFNYRATDLAIESEPATVEITITAAAGAPTAAADSYDVSEDTVLVAASAQGVLTNDTDPDGTALSASVVTPPQHGTLSLAGDGSFTYTPAANYFGTDQVTYAASDGTYGSQAVVTFTVAPTPDAPSAVNDAYDVAEDATLTLDAAAGLLGNDVDVDGDVLSAIVDTQPASGTLSVASSGAVTFTPAQDFNGPLSFTYHASDGALTSAVVNVSLTVTPVNDAPVAQGASLQTIEDEPLQGFVTATDVDGDDLTFAVTSQPAHGAVELAADTGGFRYVPDTGYRGLDAFTVVANDGQVDSQGAVIAIEVLAPPPPEVESLLPAVGAVGRPLQIHGRYLGTDATVTIGGNSATIESRSKTYVVVRIPAVAPGTRPLVLTRGDGSASTPVDFVVQPWIETISPEHGPASGSITLTGVGFTVSGNATIGGLPVTPVNWSDTTVQLTLPGGLGAGNHAVQVTVFGVTSNVVRYYVADGDDWLPTTMLQKRKRHTAVWTGNEMLVWGGHDGAAVIGTGARYDPETDSYRSISMVGAPSARQAHVAVWTGSEMLIWGGAAGAGRYDPTNDTWSALAGGPTSRLEACTVWTGSEMIVWGGVTSTVSTATNTGSRFNPATSTWQATSTTNAPSARTSPVCAWTGDRMIVWSGVNPSNVPLNTGAMYDPVTNAWTPIASSTSSVGTTYRESAAWTGTTMITKAGIYDPAVNTWTALPTPPRTRTAATMIWTGSRVIVWGGCWDQGVGGCSVDSRGEWFDPKTSTWGVINTGLPGTSMEHTAVWTGVEMIAVGGGSSGAGNGGIRYVASNGALSETRSGTTGPYRAASLVWTGSTAIAYGGIDPVFSTSSTSRVVTTTPAAREWTQSSASGAPSARNGHSATWTGSRMVVFGGSSGTTYLGTGGRYDPAGAGTWQATSTLDAPSGRREHTAVWDGTYVLIFGGANNGTPIGDGARYDPATDIWTSMSATNAPAARFGHVAVWTGSEMIVWGGRGAAGYLDDGARYVPGTDTWTPIASAAQISARSRAAAVWTGTQMLVWGGETSASATTNTGAVYTPGGSWTALTTTNAPAARSRPLAAWTGTKLLVWSGLATPSSSSGLVSGGVYDVSGSSWTAMSTTDGPATTREDSVVWTGTYMLLGNTMNDEPRLYVP
ncbi:MAG: Ig-like domain-containing protein [Myxococcota bacterium]